MTMTDEQSLLHIEDDDPLAFADAALGIAGHQVTDPVIRNLARSVADHDLTVDDAVRIAVEHIYEQ